jgi:hypothetical protein
MQKGCRLPIFRLDRHHFAAQKVKALLCMGRQKRKDGRAAATAVGKPLDAKRRELERAKREVRAAEDPLQRSARKWKKKQIKLEAFRLAAERQAGGAVGALPDFIVIGVQKGGTTVLYRLLSGHPDVRPAALKEIHYFDDHFDEGAEWYRRCFPTKQEDGRRTITGEATPAYLFDPLVPKRMAEVVPEARLIALLRNPVDRAYSHYNQRVRRGLETRSFEEAVYEQELWLLGGTDGLSERETHHWTREPGRSYLSRGIYVDQLARFSRFFDKGQLLVLKSEDLSKKPRETFPRILTFLDLPDWHPEQRVARNTGRYESMGPATRRRLEEFFRPHNRRLYEYVGIDFGW